MQFFVYWPDLAELTLPVDVLFLRMSYFCFVGRWIQVSGILARLCCLFPITKRKAIVLRESMKTGRVWKLHVHWTRNSSPPKLYKRCFCLSGGMVFNLRHTNVSEFRHFFKWRCHSFKYGIILLFNIFFVMFWLVLTFMNYKELRTRIRVHVTNRLAS